MADDLEELRGSCTRELQRHGNRTARDVLAELPDDITMDRYGEGGVVAELEARVADLLGLDAALFFPSGTMAQQIALRIHAEDRQRRTVLWHPRSHLAVHELDAHQHLHGLVGRAVGRADRVLRREDLDDVAEPVAALLLELPQRDLGGALPERDDLAEQLAWAAERGAARHLDGARLWEAAAGWGVAPAEVASTFDSAYVSFYKGLGALPGCCLAGSEDLVARAREWRRRHGGTLFGLWPLAASAMAALDRRLPRIPEYVAFARAVADELTESDDVEVVPTRPLAGMFHLHLRTTVEDFAARARDIARTEQVWTWPQAAPSGRPDWVSVELSVGEATLALEPAEVRRLVERLAVPVG